MRWEYGEREFYAFMTDPENAENLRALRIARGEVACWCGHARPEHPFGGECAACTCTGYGAPR